MKTIWILTGCLMSFFVLLIASCNLESDNTNVLSSENPTINSQKDISITDPATRCYNDYVASGGQLPGFYYCINLHDREGEIFQHFYKPDWGFVIIDGYDSNNKHFYCQVDLTELWTTDSDNNSGIVIPNTGVYTYRFCFRYTDHNNQVIHSGCDDLVNIPPGGIHFYADQYNAPTHIYCK